MAIRLITLGGLRGSLDGAEIDRLTSQELSAALLVFLAIERSATRDSLMAMLWPDQDSGTAGHRLSQMLYSLRQTLGPDCLDARGRDILAGSRLEADAPEFERAVEEGNAAPAVSLYGGPFLEGVHLAGTHGFENWADRLRGRYARLFRRASKSLVEERVSVGDLPGALAAARAWVAPDPLDDEAQHKLIELLAREGERSQALKQYATYKGLLDVEGLEPLDETRELVRRIRETNSRSGQGPDAGPPITPELDLETRVRNGLAPDLEVLRSIGRGSTASVFLAREPALERLVAVKVLSPRISADDVARRRFEREARSAARIVHANVAQIYRLSSLEGVLPFIVMEFIDGRSVTGILAACGAFDPQEARPVIAAVASALAAAHDRRVIHRDVTPGNIFIENRSGRPVLTDFGIAGLLESGDRDVSRLTPAGYRLGNVRYMSPEVARGESATDVSDVYALGVVAFEMLAGEHPFGALAPEQMIVAHLQQEPRSLQAVLSDVDEGLSSVIARCLAKVPGHRPRARDVAAMLAQPA